MVLLKNRNQRCFSASLLFKSIRNDQPDLTELWEDVIVITLADTLEEATDQFNEFGTQYETDYQSVAGFQIEWKFDSIERIQEIDNPEGQTVVQEVFSRFLSDKEVKFLKQPLE